MRDYVRQLQRFNVGEDCPVFDGLFEFCQIYTSGSIGKKPCMYTLKTVLNHQILDWGREKKGRVGKGRED